MASDDGVHDMGYARDGFNSLLLIEHLTKLISFNSSLTVVWHAADMLTVHCRHIFCAHINHG